MKGRRDFLKAMAGGAAAGFPAVVPSPALGRGGYGAAGESGKDLPREVFPVTVQWSRLPGSPGPVAGLPKSGVRAMVDEILQHGFTGLEFPLHLPDDETAEVLEYAKSRGMYITFNRTFEKGAVENFGRKAPPPVPVFSPEYAAVVRRNIMAAFDRLKGIPHPYNISCYQDEPFHAGPESFDYSEEARREFKRRFHYDLPPDLESARRDPRIWLDFVNFQSDEFSAGWRQAYKIIKEIDPRVKVMMTHDSHSTFGGGVASNSKIAVDDVFHWGADFADLFVFDIYPYMMFDYRYGECGKLREPRLSQMHYGFAQMRNLTYRYGKDLGFWFGTFNKRWFAKFLGPELKAKYWAERETTFTAVAQGANFLISGYLIPEDARHWESLGEGLRLLQKAPGLLKTPKKRAKACFLFPRTQYVQLQEEYWNVGLSYELFLRAFGELDVIHEEQVRDGQLNGYELLAIFDVRLLPEDIAREVAAFVERGGVVVADSVPSLDADQKPSHTMETLFGVRDAETRRIKRSGVWVPSLENPHWLVPPEPGEKEAEAVKDRVRGAAFDVNFDFNIASPRPCRAVTGDVLIKTSSGNPAAVQRRVGKGQAFLLGFCVQDTYFQSWKDKDGESRSRLRELLHRMTEAAGIHPHVYSSNAEVEVALRINAEEGYVIAINHEAENSATNVRLAALDFTPGEIVDLEDGAGVKFSQHDGGISFDLKVSQDRPRLLRLRPRKG